MFQNVSVASVWMIYMNDLPTDYNGLKNENLHRHSANTSFSLTLFSIYLQSCLSFQGVSTVSPQITVLHHESLSPSLSLSVSLLPVYPWWSSFPWRPGWPGLWRPQWDPVPDWGHGDTTVWSNNENTKRGLPCISPESIYAFTLTHTHRMLSCCCYGATHTVFIDTWCLQRQWLILFKKKLFWCPQKLFWSGLICHTHTAKRPTCPCF